MTSYRSSAIGLGGLIVGIGVVLFGLPVQADWWPRCHHDDGCSELYLNVVTERGQARLRVSETCGAGWHHSWGRADARRTIRQWLNDDSRHGSGHLCIRLASEVDEIRVTALGGHCGYPDGTANRPGPNITLRRGAGNSAVTELTGCHARIGAIAFGGVALDFADGYGFGDAYAEGYFYGVYDGWRRDAVRPLGASVWDISQFNTFHYRVEILAGGSGSWRADFQEAER